MQCAVFESIEGCAYVRDQRRWQVSYVMRCDAMCEGSRAPTVKQRVGLGEELVLKTHTGDASLLELVHESARVVEVAVARIAIEQDRDRRVVAHELRRCVVGC